MKSRFRNWSLESENQGSLSEMCNIHASSIVYDITLRDKTENCTPAKKCALPGAVLVPPFILIVSFVLFLKHGRILLAPSWTNVGG
jgi:hypothetical protein